MKNYLDIDCASGRYLLEVPRIRRLHLNSASLSISVEDIGPICLIQHDRTKEERLQFYELLMTAIVYCDHTRVAKFVLPGSPNYKKQDTPS